MLNPCRILSSKLIERNSFALGNDLVYASASSLLSFLSLSTCRYCSWSFFSHSSCRFTTAPVLPPPVVGGGPPGPCGLVAGAALILVNCIVSPPAISQA